MTSLAFHYFVSGHAAGGRPGAHQGRGEGTGQRFASHRRLFDHPDPRRIDVRASLRNPSGEWLVKLFKQRVAVRVHVIVDVSASMHVGAPQRKLDAVADFVEGLGLSSHGMGDALGLSAFDGVHAAPCAALNHPPRLARGVGAAMAAQLRAVLPPPKTRHAMAGEGLLACAQALAAQGKRDGLVFVVSDFHGVQAQHLHAALDTIGAAQVVPMLVWDRQEMEPPTGQGLLPLVDAETRSHRSLWMRRSLRQQWREAISTRRQALTALFAQRDCPLHELLGPGGRFDADALTRYFYESRL
jgi:uncharacterized protein (DUF58 family)